MHAATRSAPTGAVTTPHISALLPRNASQRIPTQRYAAAPSLDLTLS